jgi:uncharacterized iron-regulated membrane protein
VSAGNPSSLWRRILRDPRSLRLRKIIFQVHLWSGIVFGAYLLLMSITGSVLVYSNEIYVAATPEPIVSESSAPRLTDPQLTDAPCAAIPDFAS